MADVREINPEVPPSGTGCAECLAADPTGWWFHLRRCAQCGHIGCCDSSPSQHARAHFFATDHRYVQSFEPGEDWFWDFETDEYAAGPQLVPPFTTPKTSRHPARPAPCPRTGSSASTDSALLPSTATKQRGRELLRLDGGWLSGQNSVELAA